MNPEETPQNPPPDPKKDDSLMPIPRKQRRQAKTCKLDLLPPEIKAELDKCIAQDLGSKRCRTFLIERYGTQSKLVYAAVGTYDHYLTLNEARIKEAARLDKELVADAAKDLSDLKSMTTSQTPLDDQRKALTQLYNRAEARIKRLELEAASDPRKEALLNQYWKEQRAILESYHAIREELEKERPEELNKEFTAYTSMFLHWVQVAYVKTHADHKAIEFQAYLTETFKEGLDHWMAERHMGDYGI